MEDKPWIKDFIAMEDGYQVYWPLKVAMAGMGGLPSHILRQIADDLDKANEDWGRQVQAYFDAEKSIEFDPKLHHRIWQEDKNAG